MKLQQNPSFGIFLAVFLTGMALAILRTALALEHPPEPFTWFNAYKDIAHVYVGGLGVAWWIQRQQWQIVLFVGLNGVEVAAAIYSRI